MDKNKQQKQLVLLFGATGKSGFHIAQRLLESKNHPVKIVVRSKAKLQQLFKEKQMAFQSIVQGDACDQNTLQKAFQESKHYGPVKIVISALGAAGFQSQQKISQVQSTGLGLIVDHSKRKNIDKFIMITAAFMQRPWHPVPVIISTLVPNVYHYKAIAQNNLRNSGLNYIIIRPPQLRGDVDDATVTGYNIVQGDKTSGHISRRTLSEVVFHSMNSVQIPQKVTFQCLANIKNNQCKSEDFSSLKNDTRASIVNANHKLAKYTYWAFFAVGLISGMWLLANKLRLNLSNVSQSL